jgi:hypothetical protein
LAAVVLGINGPGSAQRTAVDSSSAEQRAGLILDLPPDLPPSYLDRENRGHP